MRRALKLALIVAAAGAASIAAAQPTAPPPGAAQPPGPAPAPLPPIAPLPPAPAPVIPAPVNALPPEEAAPPASDAGPAAPKPPPKPEPPKRQLYTAAVIQALDKITADTLRFEAPLHKPIRYKGLIFLVNTCQTVDDDHPEAAAHLEIDSQPPALPGRPANPVKVVFRGWMFADAPGPHPFEHPVYDAWLVACKQAATP